ncbi:PSME3-interacting protein-like isoform X3 [Melopsittacus undulatus]|uniref:PSME3-interacting protein-like isoform X3 n=1 Tax=Melopsittacus undulatus TaxID=13146 RepID=UPI00146D7BB7|nr:PSME3-interacting protein-like isoform X3 [Melopsittacus undulatus]
MDGADGTADLVINKRFVSDSELEEQWKRRQEEWEKVRKLEDPEECPEEAYNSHSFYEILQEQREKKQEFEEQFKFKNMLRGLDEDETHSLDEVSQQQELLENQQREEELKELNEYRSTLTEVGVSVDPKKETEKKLPMKSVENKKTFSQAKPLAGAVKHRRASQEPWEGTPHSFARSHDTAHSPSPAAATHPPAEPYLGTLQLL